MLDALRRAYPNAAQLGVRAGKDASVPKQDDALTIAIHRVSGGDGKEIASAAGGLLHKLERCRIRAMRSLPMSLSTFQVACYRSAVTRKPSMSHCRQTRSVCWVACSA